MTVQAYEEAMNKLLVEHSTARGVHDKFQVGKRIAKLNKEVRLCTVCKEHINSASRINGDVACYPCMQAFTKAVRAIETILR